MPTITLNNIADMKFVFIIAINVNIMSNISQKTLSASQLATMLRYLDVYEDSL